MGGESGRSARSAQHGLRSASRTSEDPAGLPQFVYPRHLSPECLRVNITVDQAVLRQTDEAAEARGLTRSTLIESGLATVIDG